MSEVAKRIAGRYYGGDPHKRECLENDIAAAIAVYINALESIAGSTCCDRCQEAALVAKAALR
jgi:hypothetical protein